MKYELVVMGGFFVMVGLVGGQSASEAYDQVSTLRGPRGKLVRGKIVNALIESRDGAEEKEYQAVITYQYFVDGKQYESTVLDCGISTRGGWSNNEENAKGIYNQYPVGKEVNVHYDSMKPELAALQLTPTTRGEYRTSMLISLGLALLGAWLCFEGCGRSG